MSTLAGLLEAIVAEARPQAARGTVARYIPALARVPADRFGIAVVELDGTVHASGDAHERFSIQSIAKLFSVTQALRAIGEGIFLRVGREPSGTAFNSLVQLEVERGIPRNPFLNAGALVVADVLLGAREAAFDELLAFIRERAGHGTIDVDREVLDSERATGFRNAALANFLRSFGNLTHGIDAVLEFYFAQCSIAMSCVELARSALFLANRGVCPRTGERVLTPSQCKRVNALMLTCGTYDAAGDFAYEVGMPAKSGVGGGIVAVIPERLAIAVWSPPLDPKGNSLAGSFALERFTTHTGWSIF
jgi:glutaminase